MSALESWERQVELRRPSFEDAAEFIHAMQVSQSLHHPWVFPPVTESQYKAYCILRRQRNEDGFLVIDKSDDQIVGAINLSVITYGALDSAYISYYVSAQHAGKGYMTLGLHQVIEKCFTDFKLHRLEANIQPDNQPSINLVKRCGFNYEGLARKFIKVAGRWRDHERWALIKEDWALAKS